MIIFKRYRYFLIGFCLSSFLLDPSFLIAQQPELVLPVGHTGAVTSVCFSPDGHYALSGSDDHTLILWDIQSGKEICSFQGHKDIVNSVCFSPDGLYALSGSDDHTLKLWDLQSGKELRSFNGHSDIVNSVSFSPDSRYALSGSWDKTLKLWDVQSGKELSSFEGNTSDITPVCFSPDGLYTLSGSKDSTMKLREIQSGKVVRSFEGHTDLVHTVCFSPDGWYALSGSGDKTMKLWDIQTGNELRSFEGHTDWVCAVCFSPDGRYALSGSYDNTLKLWDILSGKEIRSFKGHTWFVSSVCFSPDGRYGLSGSADKTMRLWDIQSGKEVTCFKGHTDWVYTVCYSPDGLLALSGSGDNTAKLWDMQSGTEILSFHGHTYNVMSVCFSPDGRYALSGSGDKTAKLWDISSGREIRSFEGHTDWVLSVCFSPDGLYAMSGSGDKTVKLWDVQSGKEIRNFEGHADWVYAVCFSPDGRYALSGSADKTMKLWDIRNGKLLRTFKGHTYNVMSVCFSPDGRYALSGSADKTMKLWDAQSGKELRSFEGHARDVISVCFSADGQYALSGSADKTLKLWDIQSGKEIRSFKGHTDWVCSVCLSPDGRYALSGSHDNTLKFWDISRGNEIATLIPIDSNDYIAVTPDKYYHCSKNANIKLGWRIGKTIFGFDQFDLKYNRPDIFLERIGYASPELVDTYRIAYYKRLKKMGFTEEMLKEDFHVPEIEILNRDEIETQAPSSRLQAKIKALDNKYKLDRLNVWVNDVPIYGTSGIDLRSMNTDSVHQTIDVELSSGNNKIQVSVLNQAGAESLKESFYVNYNAESFKPDLYLIAISVSDFRQKEMKLNYSVKDGRDLVNLYASQTGFYDQIHIDTLFNQQATRENVLHLKDRLMQSRVDDQVILYLSGHGLLDDSLDFYYATYNMDFTHPEKFGILYDDIEGVLDGIPARKKLLLIDACHSGEVDKEELVAVTDKAKTLADGSRGDVKVYDYRGVDVLQDKEGIGLQNSFELMQELFTNLSRGSGAVVISAAAGKGYALESSQWNNGVFTYAVLNGLKNKAAEKDQQEGITVIELKDYVINEVESLTNGRQKPTCRRENLEVDWRVW